MGDMDGMHHHDAPAAGEKLGSVSFPVSCEASSKVPMERGIALLHSFGYEEAEEQFTALTKSDPKLCDGLLGRRDERLPSTMVRQGLDG